MFSIPSIVILAACGMTGWVWKPLLLPRNVVAIGMVFLLLLFSVLEFIRPQVGINQDLEILERELESNDYILTDLFEAQIINFYILKGSLEHEHIIHEWVNETNQLNKISLVEVLQSIPLDCRVWLMSAAVDYHRTHTAELRPEAYQMIKLLSSKRKVLYKRTSPRSTLYLFSPESSQMPRSLL